MFSSPRKSATRKLGLAWIGFVSVVLCGVTPAQEIEYLSVYRANTDGSDVEQILTSDQTLAKGGFAIDPDPVDLRLYWTALVDTGGDFWLFTIRRATANGENVHDFVPPDAMGSIAIDSVHDRIYYVLHSDAMPDDSICRINLDGTDEECVVHETVAGGLAIDPDGGKIYWSYWYDETIHCADLDGNDEETLITEAGLAGGMAVDEMAGKLYWVVSGSGVIRRANLNGSEVEDVVTGLSWPAGFAIHPPSNRMWWAEHVEGKIQQAALDGSGVTDVLTGLDSPGAIGFLEAAGDPAEDKLYWLSDPAPLSDDVPATSGWGVLTLVVLVLAASTTVLTRHRASMRRRGERHSK